jgi:DNA-directed RNA polymerase subunit omega
MQILKNRKLGKLKGDKIMLHPSYSDLMKVVNKDVEEGDTNVVNSRYSIVMATAKRARQIVDGSIPLVEIKDDEKPLSIAVDELNHGVVKILSAEQEEEFDELLDIDEDEFVEDAEDVLGDIEVELEEEEEKLEEE